MQLELSGRLELGVVACLSDMESYGSFPCDFLELLMFNGQLERVDANALLLIIRRLQKPVKFVHVQEFITHGGSTTLLDLSSDDDEIRSLSVRTVESSRELCDELGGLPLVIHPGGIREKPADREKLSSNLRNSLGELGPRLLLLENMPWYYWLKGFERMSSNVGLNIRNMGEFIDLVTGFVLDTSHGYLSRPDGDGNFCEEFMKLFGEKVTHIHVSDAMVPDKEGLQIGDGEIDFSFLRNVRVPVLVEVWDGHKNGGEGFRSGIERLRAMEESWRSEPRRKVL